MKSFLGFGEKLWGTSLFEIGYTIFIVGLIRLALLMRRFFVSYQI
ncbi:hypothetical protein ABXT08_07500 [Chryseobacterium sp. NRRL B-14859]